MLILEYKDQRRVDLGSWEAGDWWPRLKALAPTSWYVDEMVAQGGYWREEMIPARVTGLSRDLTVLRARRKSDWIVSEWHGDRTTFCPPLYDDLAIGSGACGLCRACFLVLTHRIRRDPWRHLLYDNVEEFWPQAAAWLRGDGRYAYTRKACTQRTLGLGIDRSDSLLFEGITGHARALAPLFASERSNPDGRQLILLTKSTNTHYLAGLPAANVVVSMSLNPQAVADCWENVWPDGERVTRPIGERVQALVAAQEMGFVIRLRLDPILPIPGWQDLYQQFLAEATAAGLRPGRVTLGLYRQQTGQLAAWARRWGLPPLGWQPPAMVRDGTHEQLPAEQRVTIYREVATAVRVAWPDAEVSLCKEIRAVRSAVGVTASRCNCLATSRPSGQSHPSPGAAFPKS